MYLQYKISICAFVVLLLVVNKGLVTTANVSITSVGTAVIDSFIQFHSVLDSKLLKTGVDNLYRYEWTEEKGGLNVNITSNESTCILKYTFTREKYKKGNYTLLLAVYKRNYTENETREFNLTSTTHNFTLTDTINGDFTATQSSVFHQLPNVYATKHPVTVVVNVKDTFENATVVYTLIANETVLTKPQNVSYITEIPISEPGSCVFKVNVSANISITEGNSTNYVTRQGLFVKTVPFWDEITKISYVGKTKVYTTYGLVVIFLCDGSPPFNYSLTLRLLNTNPFGPSTIVGQASENNLDYCSAYSYFNTTDMGTYLLSIMTNNSITTTNMDIKITAFLPDYFIPSFQPFIIVMISLIILVIIIILGVAVYRDSQPKPPQYPIEVARQTLYQADLPPQSYLSWLAGAPDSYPNQVIEWFKRKRRHLNQRNRSQYGSVGEQSDSPVMTPDRPIVT